MTCAMNRLKKVTERNQKAVFHRIVEIVESLRLEKNSKIFKSKHRTNNSIPTKPYPEMPYLHILVNTFKDSDHSFSKEIFPVIQSKLSLKKLEAMSSHPITSYLGEETNTHLTTVSFQVVIESDKVSPQPPLLQTKQPQFPQPLLIRLVL